MAVPPQNWKEKSLGDLFEFKNGFNADALQYGTGMPVASVLDALQSTPMTEHTIREKVQADWKTVFPFCLKKGDLVFMRSSETLEDVGWCNVYNGTDWKALFGGFVIRGRPKAKFDSVFLNYLLRLPQYRKRIANEGAGAVHYNIGQRGLAKVRISLPPLSEQHRIAKTLGTVDKLIDNLALRIEKKRMVKQGVMQDLLTGKKRLPGFKGQWVERKIGNMLSIGHGQDYKALGKGDIPVYGSGGYMCSVSDFLHDGPTVCIGRKGTIDKPFFHEGKIWTVDTLFYTHSFRNADPKFLYYAFLRVDWPALNTASGVPSLTAQTIEQLPLEVPADLDEQRAIASVLSGMDAEIAVLEAKREKYERIKQGMMHDLLTGKVRI